MTERTSQPITERDYIPGMGKHYLLPLYDIAHHVFGLRRIHQEMITLAGLRDGHKVLDVGCGTGNLLRLTGKLHPGVELSGLDPDPKMLVRARRKVRGARLDRGFAQELPYADGSFDRVFSSLMLHHLDSASKDELLAEVRRVLRPDGLLVLADAVFDKHNHGRPRRMSELVRDNIGDGVARRIAAAGFTVQPTRMKAMRIGGNVGIELARPAPRE
ncbi:class I SAM-dependent methyltransferase [Actinocrispum sp. NPDC049592]|uniref:class I SAM-dependent methyltransferase n=1 Tax=Actinocrispum sp. NPDC049592 TaxID=3154835 RepID=UPI00342B87C1